MTSLKNGFLQIEEICRPGKKFTFQVGLNFSYLDRLMQRVKEAYARFTSIPVISEVAASLEKIVLVSSIHGTNSVEGGLLTEEETKQIIESRSSFTSTEEQKRRVLNLKDAYFYAEKLISNSEPPLQVPFTPFEFSEQNIKYLHQLAMKNLVPESELGRYRGRMRNKSPTKVSDPQHGGVYIPPLCLEDIQALMQGLLNWLKYDFVKELPILYSAPLIHYYFERIHPFADGNGRVGRILEAMQLRLGMGKFVTYGIWQYYWENIDEYFNVFNLCRKAEERKEEYPNTAFVEFFLKGMLSTINRLQDCANQIIAGILFENHLHWLLSNKKINRRQNAILSQLKILAPLTRANLNNLPWYQGLYDKLTKQTKSRDLRELVDLNLITLEDDRINLLRSNSGVLLAEHPDAKPDKS